jgi:peptidyl-prolyl cis-trans isomerase C
MKRIWAVMLAVATAGWALVGCCDQACEPDGAEAAESAVEAPAAAPEAAISEEAIPGDEAAVDEIDLDEVVFPDEEAQGAEAPSVSPTDSLPDVVATVDGKEITKATVEKMMGIIRQQMQVNFPAGQLDAVLPRMQEQVIRELIDRQILLNAAADTAFTDAEFEAELAEMKQELPPGVTFEELLEKTGMDMGEVREQMRIRKMLLAKAEEAVPATEEECRAFFEENKGGMAQDESVEASHILVAVPRDADEAARAAARAKIDGLKAQLDAGADFAELAKANSDCPSKANGGSLGMFGRGMMVPEFEDAAFSQEIGKVGDVVETTFGYHLVLVTKRSEAKEADYDEVKDRIAELLSAQRQQEAVRTFVEGLEAAATVERFDKGLQEETPALPFGLEIVDEDPEELAEEAEIVAEEAEVAAEEAAVMADAAEAIAEKAKAAAEAAAEKTAEKAEDAVEAASGAAEDAVAAASDAVEEAKDAAAEVAEQAVEAAEDAAETAQAVTEDAQKAVAEAAGDVRDAIGESAVEEKGEEVADQVADAVSGAADAVAEAAGDALDAAKEALGAVTAPAADAAE